MEQIAATDLNLESLNGAQTDAKPIDQMSAPAMIKISQGKRRRTSSRKKARVMFSTEEHFADHIAQLSQLSQEDPNLEHPRPCSAMIKCMLWKDQTEQPAELEVGMHWCELKLTTQEDRPGMQLIKLPGRELIGNLHDDRIDKLLELVQSEKVQSLCRVALFSEEACESLPNGLPCYEVRLQIFAKMEDYEDLFMGLRGMFINPLADENEEQWRKFPPFQLPVFQRASRIPSARKTAAAAADTAGERKRALQDW
eukprot:NODE_3500_length_921_cov_2.727064_g2907_i0.p1 GENE.NODE_3500_length_921_cov_2.727064_g2907_i0~~NODE_3500_length_921_cov_2.727064_g2907_i0.p1  ORF type:complete len:254 (+),score=30.88 NODE_3500_length_921_cov_2.727064_g2907_i0:79-840(+)